MRSTPLLSTFEKDARWDSVLAAAWLCSHCAAPELGDPILGELGRGRTY